MNAVTATSAGTDGGELRREDRGSVRRIAVERRVDDTKVTALRRRSLSVPSGVGIRDDTEVAVRV